MLTDIGKLEFDDFKANDELVRRVFMRRLKHDRTWNHLGLDGGDPYVTFVNNSFPAQLLLRAMRVYWQLVNEGILIPGRLSIIEPNISGLDDKSFGPPYFSLTRYGADVLSSPEFDPHHPKAYMEELCQVSEGDPTVLAYMTDAVESFRRGALAASMITLGVAAERVFLQVCDSVLSALESEKDRAKLSDAMNRFAMKPTLDWISEKFQSVQKRLLDSTSLLVVSIYNLARLQRNELGHPSDEPPRVRREEARAYLQMFPPSYAKAQELRSWLSKTKI